MMLTSHRSRTHRRRSVRVAGCAAVALFALTLPHTASAQLGTVAPRCQADGPMVSLPELNEASGLAVSQATPGRLWTHNDSGQPIVFAVDTRGTITARVRLTGATVEDWEAIALGPCPAGSCLYVADIGDNEAARSRITIYRLPEPASDRDSSPSVEALHATYPDGAHNAETLLVTPRGELFIVTKGAPGGGAIYRFPANLQAGGTHRLERVGEPRPIAKPGRSESITDGAVSPDGAWVALRTGQRVTFHRSADVLTGDWREASSMDLRSLGEAQGEAVAFAAATSLYLAGEGGRKSRPGSLAHLTCALN